MIITSLIFHLVRYNTHLRPPLPGAAKCLPHFSSSAWFAFLLPAFATYKALSRKDPDAVQNLSMYWCTVGVLVGVEYICEWFISWQVLPSPHRHMCPPSICQTRCAVPSPLLT